MLFVNGATQAQEFGKKWLQSITPKKISLFTDLHLLKVEGKIGMHSVAAVRDLIEKANLSPFEASGKVFIVEDAERMLLPSANALLKTVEEPPPNTLIILVSHEPQKILATIRSRSQLVRFKPVLIERKRLIENAPTNVHEIIAFATEMQDHFDALKENLEKEFSKRLEKETKDMTAVQRNLIELRSDGEISSRFLEEVDELLKDVGALFRENASEKTLKALSWAKLAVARSMPIKHVLESLFFRLQKI